MSLLLFWSSAWPRLLLLRSQDGRRPPCSSAPHLHSASSAVGAQGHHHCAASAGLPWRNRGAAQQVFPLGLPRGTELSSPASRGPGPPGLTRSARPAPPGTVSRWQPPCQDAQHLRIPELGGGLVREQLPALAARGRVLQHGEDPWAPGRSLARRGFKTRFSAPSLGNLAGAVRPSVAPSSHRLDKECRLLFIYFVFLGHRPPW